MGFDDNEKIGFFERKCVIVSIIVIVLIGLNITLFAKYVPNYFFEELGQKAVETERTLTLVNDQNEITTVNATYNQFPQKIGSVTVNAGSTEHIEIKG